jgi:hypothetical protein
MLGKYSKLIAAIVGGLIVAVPALEAAQKDGVSVGEWLTILGLFLPAVFAALAPANTLSTGDIVDQATKDPNVNVTTTVTPSLPTSSK